VKWEGNGEGAGAHRGRSEVCEYLGRALAVGGLFLLLHSFVRDVGSGGRGVAALVVARVHLQG